MGTVNPLLSSALDALKEGNIELAEKDFTKAVSACLHEFGEIDIVTARTLAHLARVCSMLGRLEVAAPMYERILRIHEALPDPLSCDHAVALRELAVLRDQSGMHVDANLLRYKADRMVLDVQVQAVASGKSDRTESSEDEAGDERSDAATKSEGDEGESDSDDGRSASDGSGAAG